jgi:hypothetical protein
MTILLAADTDPLDLVKFSAYAIFAVALPGTLVYRSLRRTPHTFVEDVSLGVAVGLCLELPAWLAFSVLDLREWVSLWPLMMIVPFAVAPRLRRHWRVTGYAPTPPGWSWSMVAIVIFVMAYLSAVFLERNPVLPDSEHTRQYLDLAYQLSLAGEAKHHFPINLPQVSGEPLYYHWFGYAHMAMISMIGHIDLAVVSLRLVVPALCAVAVLLTGVVGWRLSGRPYAGVGAALLFWVIGEITFTNPVAQPFGTQSMFVIWHGMSVTYSWILLLALIFAITEALRAPRRGTFVLVALFALASSGAKASSLPVTLLALALSALVAVIAQRRGSDRYNLRTVVVLGAIVATAQLFATAVLFHFQTYGLVLDPFANLRAFWSGEETVVAVMAAFVVSMLIKYVGALPLLRQRLGPEQVFLIGGALAGPALYCAFSTINSQYFTRAGFTFGVLIAGWGWAVAIERARLSTRQRWALIAGAATLAVALTLIQLKFAPPPAEFGRINSIVMWVLALGAVLSLAGLIWLAVRLRRPGLAGRGSAVGLTAVLVLGAPAFVMDVDKALGSPNGGAYVNISLPRSRVEAARWVRDHSSPSDVVVTNVHCRVGDGANCNPVSFWLSAYAEREVLVEGWGFAPRRFGEPKDRFWDQPRLDLNDQAFAAPTSDLLAGLRDKYGARWLVVDRTLSPESVELRLLADLVFDNGRIGVYRLR